MTNPTQTTDLYQFISTFPGVHSDTTLMVRQFGKAPHILRMKQLVERTGLSRATLYVLMSTDPTFPKKMKLSARAVGYLESEVDTWIEARAASRVNAQ